MPSPQRGQRLAAFVSWVGLRGSVPVVLATFPLLAGVPRADELFNLVTEYEAEDFFYSRSFNGIARSDQLVAVEITMRRGRLG